MSVSSISSSLSTILTSYYTNSTSATGETSETGDDTTTGSTEEFDQEESSLSLTQGLVDTLSSISGTGTDDDSDGLSGLYDTIEMQRNSKAIANALAEYYSGTSEADEESTETDSGIDTTV